MTGNGGWAVVVPEGYRVGHWRIGTAIASGHWGSVYAADRVDGDGPATAACKFLPGNALTPAQRSTVRDLVTRECAFGAKVRGEQLIRTYEVLDVSDEHNPAIDGCTVIVMERARTSLRDILDRVTDRAPVPNAVAMMAGLAAALDDVHDAGWVHGDVSASNVLVMDNGGVRLADFGLSAELDGTHAYIPQLGSFDYTPAEWWSAPVDDRGIEARPSRDIWAFGVLAHKLLTGGRHPFPGCDPRTRASAVRQYAATDGDLQLHSELAAPWRAFIAACLDRDPAARGALAGTLADRVRALSDVPIETDAPVRHPSPHLRTLRWHIAVGVAAATVAAITAVGASALVSDSDSPTSSTQTSGDDTTALAGRTTAARIQGGRIADDSAVPARYRPMITKMARRCQDPVVTPSFLAAIVATESGFNAEKRSPATNEFGIAMWTPWVFRHWADTERYPWRSVFDPRDSIRALSDYVCWVGDALENVPRNNPVYRAVAYRTSDATVSEFGGIPPEYEEYATEVSRHLREFTDAG